MTSRPDQSHHAQTLDADYVHDAVIATDAGLTITAWNRGAELMYGWHAAEAIGCGLPDLVRVHPGDRQRHDALGSLGPGEAVWVTVDTYHKDGRAIEVEGATVALCAHDDARITGYVNVSRDVTERNRANTVHREAAAQLEMVLTSITDKFFALDSDWRYTYFNVHAKQQLISLNKDPEALLGKVLWDVFPTPTSEPALRRAMRDRVVTNDAQFFAPTGEWYENRIYPTNNGGLAVFQANIT
jgi:PAS domain S-box-containing protein